MRTRFLPAILAIFFLFNLLLAAPAQAHLNSLASSKITFENKKMHVTLLVDQLSILELNGFDLNTTKSFEDTPLTQEIKDKSFDYIQNGFQVKNNDKKMTIELESVSLPDNTNIQFDLAFTSDDLIDKIVMDYNIFYEYSSGNHKNVATIQNGDFTNDFVFSTGNRQLEMEAGVELSIWDTLTQFVIMGIEHILLGYDHLIFLLALIILGGTFMSILKIITAFTITHSVTLLLASFGIIALPGRLIESVVALSILYVGIENLVVKDTNKRWLITGAFGLIHGFGFAGSLAETQIPKNHFFEALLTFNIGVEIGQVFVVVLLLPIILYVRRFSWSIWLVRAISVAIAMFGLLWFLQRTFDLDILPFLAV